MCKLVSVLLFVTEIVEFDVFEVGTKTTILVFRGRTVYSPTIFQFITSLYILLAQEG